MGKKKFIAKGEATHFQLVHRSQQDKAGEGDADASTFVLVPAGASRAAVRRDRERLQKRGERAPDTNSYFSGSSSSGARDHINAMGMPDDGSHYDYEGHLRAMGGGTFVAKSGKVGSVPLQPVTLPAEALPSEGAEIERHLASITISERVMEPDMRAIVSGETEDFEELDDDFVLQAAEGGDDDEGGFDFDAHIARLIAASEREVGIHRRPLPEEEEGSEYGSDMETPSEGNSEEHNDEAAAATAAGGSEADDSSRAGDATRLAGGSSSRAPTAAAAFAATLAEYDSDEWGELDEEDPAVAGAAGWDAAQHDYANACMDEFLAEQQDLNWFGGLGRKTADVPRVWQGNKAAAAAAERAAVAEAAAAEDGNTGGSSSSSSGIRLGSLKGLPAPAGAGGDVAGDVVCDSDDDDDSGGGEQEDQWCPIDETFDYFKPQPEERWDCETVLSTYSTLDNRPAVLSAVAGRGGRARGGGGSSIAPSAPLHPTPILLSKKTGLPLGVLGQRRPQAESVESEAELPPAEPRQNEGEGRLKGESAEERRARKARVKQDRREKRGQKAAVKAVFKEEGKAVSRALGNPETAQRRSIFGYN